MVYIAFKSTKKKLICLRCEWMEYCQWMTVTASNLDSITRLNARHDVWLHLIQPFRLTTLIIQHTG